MKILSSFTNPLVLKLDFFLLYLTQKRYFEEHGELNSSGAPFFTLVVFSLQLEFNSAPELIYTNILLNNSNFCV